LSRAHFLEDSMLGITPYKLVLVAIAAFPVLLLLALSLTLSAAGH
jgi:hypothetical protein